MLNRRQFQLSSLATIVAGGFIDAASNGAFVSGVQPSEEWAQWGGPNRDFKASQIDGDRLLPKPVLSWKRDLGKGHAAVVASGEFGYSLHLDGDEEVLEKWRLDNGQQSWSCRYKVGYHASYPKYDGPHATPVIQKDRIIVASIDAQIRAIDLSNGRVIWNRDLRADYGTKLPQSGYACSPIVWQDRVILPTLGESQPVETESFNPRPKIPGGRIAIPGAVAMDGQTGDEVWRTETFRSSHSSPVKIEIDDQPQLVFHGMFELIGVDPKNGKVLWKQLLRREAADNVSFTPIWDADRSQFLISHGYCNFGTQAIKLKNAAGRWRTSINWTNSRLQIVHTNAVLLGNILVGTKRPAATLIVAIDVRDGRTIFRKRGFGKSNLLAVGLQLVILDESGDLVGGQLNEEGVSELWRIPALSKTAWTVPALAGRRLLLRNGSELKVYRFP